MPETEQGRSIDFAKAGLTLEEFAAFYFRDRSLKKQEIEKGLMIIPPWYGTAEKKILMSILRKALGTGQEVSLKELIGDQTSAEDLFLPEASKNLAEKLTTIIDQQPFIIVKIDTPVVGVEKLYRLMRAISRDDWMLLEIPPDTQNGFSDTRFAATLSQAISRRAGQMPSVNKERMRSFSMNAPAFIHDPIDFLKALQICAGAREDQDVSPAIAAGKILADKINNLVADSGDKEIIKKILLTLANETVSPPATIQQLQQLISEQGGLENSERIIQNCRTTWLISSVEQDLVWNLPTVRIIQHEQGRKIFEEAMGN